MRVIDAGKAGVLCLGYAGEKDRTTVLFPFGDIAAEFPGGTVVLRIRRPWETDHHDLLPTISEDGTTAEWLVDDYDLENRGEGEVQLIYSDGTAICKKKVWETRVNRSIDGDNASVPPDWEDIENALVAAAGNVSREISEAEATLSQAVADAQAAQTAAETAQGAAETAQQDAETAKAGAEAAVAAAEAAQDRAEAAEGNAAADAADAAQSAQDAANSASAAALSASGAATSAAGAEADRITAQGAKIAAEAAQAGAEAAQAAAEAAVAGIETAGAAQVAAVNAAGTTQTGNVNTAGTTQVAAVNAAGAAVIESIPSDYSALTGDVTNLKNAINDLQNEIMWTDEATDVLDAIGSAIPFTTAQGGELWDNLISILRGTFVSYSVVWSGSNYTASNISSHVADGASYSCTVTPSEGFVISALTVTMGNAAIVPTQNQDGTYTITIASVTDDVIIAVTTSVDPSALIYHVENLVCDGTQEAIETSLAFSSADANGVTNGWTLCCTASVSSNVQHKMPFCAGSGSDSSRLAMTTYNNSCAQLRMLGTYNNLDMKSMLNHRTKVVITHEAGSDSVLTAYYVSKTTEEIKKDVFTAPNNINKLSDSNGDRSPLNVGCGGSNGAFVGTIHELTIYNYTFTDDQAEEYVAEEEE